MNSRKFITHSSAQTKKIGEQLAKLCRGGEIICLSGDLGAGKTTFVKGIATGLKIDERKVNSPTFVIMNVYEGRLPLSHFDFYRLEDPKEIAGIGYDEFLYGQGVAVIEWSERFGPLMPQESLQIRFQSESDTTRLLHFSSKGKRYAEVLEKMST